MVSVRPQCWQAVGGPRDKIWQADQVQRGSQSYPSGCTLEVGWRQRHSPDAVPGHCPSQARLRIIVYGTASNTNLQLDSIHSDPLLLGLVTHLCQWRNPRNSSGFGGICASLSRNTSGRWRPSARRPSVSSEWLHTWSGVGTETPSWCCTRPLSVPS